MTPRRPTSTYRLQFSGHLHLAGAATLVDYLWDLGISDVYASPLFRARQQSRSGYDVIDHNAIDPELGTEDDLAALAGLLRAREMGLLLDVVPNHMGVDDANNAWWQDVLEHGRNSPYAHFFDIDWEPPKTVLQGCIVLPVLGDQYGNVLERGELKLAYEGQRFLISYYHRTFPIAARTWPRILQPALERHLSLPADDSARMELESIVTSLVHQPAAGPSDREAIRAARREEEVARRRLAALLESNLAVQEAVAATLTDFNGRVGDPRSFDSLEALLAEQTYRLCYWRVAADEINYRRFFDINELAALRVEDPDVFAASHEMVFRWLERGWVTGLRIDHPDGLLDPEQYLLDLQEGYRRLVPDAPPGPTPLYVVVERILRYDQPLTPTWPVHGTTGYDFLNQVNGVFVDRHNAARIKEIYAAFTDVPPRFSEIGYQSKRDILATSMSSELHMLAGRLDRISEQHRSSRDFTLASLCSVLAETIACFPVYRSYVRPGRGPVGDEDRRHITTALRIAQRRNPGINSSLFNFLGSILLVEDLPELTETQRAERYEFVYRFQQLTGPVTAKGLEDTALYRAYPLPSLNEVGGEPAEFGNSLEQFHRRIADRAANWPASLMATTTHDTKRSEDVRARLNVLSEVPDLWEHALLRWRSLNRRHKTQIEGSEAPDGNEEYLLYATLVGTWPPAPVSDETRAIYVDRIVAYMIKVAREAKLHTSWVNSSEEYEKAIEAFVRHILEKSADNPFSDEMAEFQKSVAVPGMYNALGQTLIKIMAPGVPDFYQGTELWDDSLVDPDNRRPVDLALRRRLLTELAHRGERDEQALVNELVDRWTDGRIKLFVTWRALTFRREHQRLLNEGAYVPLTAEGPKAEQICAFARATDDEWAIVVAPRWMSRLLAPGQIRPDPGAWDATHLIVPPEAPRGWRELFTSASLTQVPGSRIPLSPMLAAFPVALLHRQVRPGGPEFA